MVVHLPDVLQIAIIVYLAVGTFYDAAYFDLFYYLMAIVYVVTELTTQLLPNYHPRISGRECLSRVDT